MRWMERDPSRRADPTAVLPAARTVISVALGYYRGDWPAAPSEESGAPRGRIARYAWGRDYHKRLKKKLLRLAAAIGELTPAARTLAYVDTGPVLDRGWAERAGLGWIGKNTNVILKGRGSWSFLGEILTDLVIPPDPPARNYCGRCARCIAACPTGAIVGPYELDARRCISYLTIEHRGPIPLALRPAIGTRIFGCDDCQEVCPWNRFATRTANPDFSERPEQQTPELIPLLNLDLSSFAVRYQGTALRRAGRDRFVRNVAVALGNLGDPRATEPLRRSLERDPSALVRGHAAWALGRIGGEEARAALTSAWGTEADPDVRREIEYARSGFEQKIDNPKASRRPVP
jgi:epoxyqueuosine reductase